MNLEIRDPPPAGRGVRLFHFSPLVMSATNQTELLIRTCAAIASELVAAHESNKSVNLNVLRSQQAKRFGFGGVPRLVDIIAAVPDEHKKALLPKLRARPIRTASGVRLLFICLRLCTISQHLLYRSP